MSYQNKERLVTVATLVVIACFLFALTAHASQKIAGQTTSQITAPAAVTAQAVSGPAIFHGLIVKTDGTNAVTINVYNGTTTAGDKLIPTDTVIPASTSLYAAGYAPGLAAPGGIYVTISVAGGGTCTYQVQYDQ